MWYQILDVSSISINKIADIRTEVGTQAFVIIYLQDSNIIEWSERMFPEGKHWPSIADMIIMLAS